MKITDGLISKRFFVVPLLLVAVLTILVSFLTYLYYSKIINDRYETDLFRLAASGASLIGYVGEYAVRADYDRFADAFAEHGNFRVTIISFAGTVLGDSKLSYEEVLNVENHADRPEIIAAKTTGRGVSRRFSATLGLDLLYVAVRYNQQGKEGVLRVALPLTALQQDLAQQRFTLGGFCVFALLIALAMSMFMSKYLFYLVKKNRREIEKYALDRTRELELLQNLGTQLTVSNSQQEVLDVISLITALLVPRFTGALSLLSSSKDNLGIVATWNGEWTDEHHYDPNDCWALRTGKKHIGYQSGGRMTCSHTKNKNCRMICIPLVAQGETFGAVHFSCMGDLEITAEEEQLTNAVAEHASLALASLRLRENLQHQAIKDPLTGLYNRRFFLETIEHDLSRAERNNAELAILMLDIDHFKQFNDEHGHDFGDFVLVEFSAVLQRVLRKEDIACRYGGEEFTVLLTAVTKKSAFHVADKICRKVREHKFLYNGHYCGSVTVSVGVAIFPEHGKTPGMLLKLADVALYEAKKAGRDRVILSDGKEDL